MEWYVYIQDINAHKIVKYNIFNHGSFVRDLQELKANFEDEEFPEELRKIVRRYFWKKAEWEVVITSWPPYITNEEAFSLVGKTIEGKRVHNVNLTVAQKIDVYDQLMMNWDTFCSYVAFGKEANLW